MSGSNKRKRRPEKDDGRRDKPRRTVSLLEIMSRQLNSEMEALKNDTLRSTSVSSRENPDTRDRKSKSSSSSRASGEKERRWRRRRRRRSPSPSWSPISLGSSSSSSSSEAEPFSEDELSDDFSNRNRSRKRRKVERSTPAETEEHEDSDGTSPSGKAVDLSFFDQFQRSSSVPTSSLSLSLSPSSGSSGGDSNVSRRRSKDSSDRQRKRRLRAADERRQDRKKRKDKRKKGKKRKEEEERKKETKEKKKKKKKKKRSSSSERERRSSRDWSTQSTGWQTSSPPSRSSAVSGKTQGEASKRSRPRRARTHVRSYRLESSSSEEEALSELDSDLSSVLELSELDDDDDSLLDDLVDFSSDEGSGSEEDSRMQSEEDDGRGTGDDSSEEWDDLDDEDLLYLGEHPSRGPGGYAPTSAAEDDLMSGIYGMSGDGEQFLVSWTGNPYLGVDWLSYEEIPSLLRKEFQRRLLYPVDGHRRTLELRPMKSILAVRKLTPDTRRSELASHRWKMRLLEQRRKEVIAAAAPEGEPREYSLKEEVWIQVSRDIWLEGIVTSIDSSTSQSSGGLGGEGETPAYTVRVLYSTGWTCEVRDPDENLLPRRPTDAEPSPEEEAEAVVSSLENDLTLVEESKNGDTLSDNPDAKRLRNYEYLVLWRESSYLEVTWERFDVLYYCPHGTRLLTSAGIQEMIDDLEGEAQGDDGDAADEDDDDDDDEIVELEGRKAEDEIISRAMKKKKRKKGELEHLLRTPETALRAHLRRLRTGTWFFQDFVEVDAILDERSLPAMSVCDVNREPNSEEEKEYLVKWKSMEYVTATWEPETRLRTALGKSTIPGLEEWSSLDIALARYRHFSLGAEASFSPDCFRPYRALLKQEGTETQGTQEHAAVTSTEEAEGRLPLLGITIRNLDGRVLRDYQREGVTWMAFNYNSGRSCLLGQSSPRFLFFFAFLFRFSLSLSHHVFLLCLSNEGSPLGVMWCDGCMYGCLTCVFFFLRFSERLFSG